MLTVVVRRDPDKGYYFTMHDSRGLPVVVSACWASKEDCGEYLRNVLPPEIPIEDESLDPPA